jgi:hypothetical protein
VILPLVLLILAAISAAFVAYGVHPNWGQYDFGIKLIVLSRRLEWPLVALTIILCIALIVMIIAGRQRAWWLIGLAPILALLAHHFALDSNNAFIVNADPQFVTADQATFLVDDDWVIGLVDSGDATAYPFSAMYGAPLVVQNQQNDALLLMWSPFANRALAVHTDRSLKARELEIVSMPANTLLVFNSRLGQFINGITGQTLDHQKPAGFENTIPTVKTTWKCWRTLHPDTRVLYPPIVSPNAPTRPVLPYFDMPMHTDQNGAATVAFVDSNPPVAVLDTDLVAEPKNFSGPAILLIRDPATYAVTGFVRQVDADLFPLFRADRSPKHRPAVMIDFDSESFWTVQGRAIAGPLKGKKLQPIEVDDNVYLDVLRVWYPNISPLTALPIPQPPRHEDK